jgi:hypothetical protein
MMDLRSLVLAAASLPAGPVLAQVCMPPANLDTSAVPALEPAQHAKLTHTVTATVAVPPAQFRTWFFATPLEQMLPGTRELPAVTGTARVGDAAFPTPGAVRYVCLADGNGALERVLELEPERFTYEVWGYTSPQARGIRYGFGEFTLTAAGDATLVRWTYAFRLKDDRLPGLLGPVGRFLFRAAFLDGTYADFMQAGMRAIQEGAQRTTRSAAR